MNFYIFSLLGFAAGIQSGRPWVGRLAGLFLFILIALAFTGCQSTADGQPVKGGVSKVTLGGDDTGRLEAQMRQPDNPETGASQNTTRKETVRHFAPPATPQQMAQWQVFQPPVGLTPATAPGAGSVYLVQVPVPVSATAQPLSERILEESSSTDIGSTQDVAAIMKAARSLGVKGALSVLASLSALVGAWFAWKEWRIMALVLAASGVAGLITLTWVWPVIGAVAAGLIWIAYNWAELQTKLGFSLGRKDPPSTPAAP